MKLTVSGYISKALDHCLMQTGSIWRSHTNFRATSTFTSVQCTVHLIFCLKLVDCLAPLVGFALCWSLDWTIGAVFSSWWLIIFTTEVVVKTTKIMSSGTLWSQYASIVIIGVQKSFYVAAASPTKINDLSREALVTFCTRRRFPISFSSYECSKRPAKKLVPLKSG